MRRWVLVTTLVLLVPFLVAAYALLARFVLHGPVTARSLMVSVEDASPSVGRLVGDQGRCQSARRPRDWRCAVSDRAGSGGVAYRVRVRSKSSCWNARLVADYGEGGMPDRVSGCVYRWQWSLLDLL